MGAIWSLFFGEEMVAPPREPFFRRGGSFLRRRQASPSSFASSTNLRPSEVQDPAQDPGAQPSSLERRLKVFHGTSVQSAESIQLSRRFEPGPGGGMDEPTIYFSMSMSRALEFGPMVLECEVDESAVRQIKDRNGGVVCCDNFSEANGVICSVSQERSICGPFNRCEHLECRECRVSTKRRLERAEQRQDWEKTKKPCPGVRGAPCRGSGWCKEQSRFCTDCHRVVYG